MSVWIECVSGREIVECSNIVIKRGFLPILPNETKCKIAFYLLGDGKTLGIYETEEEAINEYNKIKNHIENDNVKKIICLQQAEE